MRAQRYALHLSLRYRRIGEFAWHQGQTENISRSGVLFKTDDPFEVDTPVEFSMALATAMPRRDGAEVRCRGRVVRTVSPWDSEGHPVAAVIIEEYDFLPPAAAALTAES
jgi:hypothetical protein